MAEDLVLLTRLFDLLAGLLPKAKPHLISSRGTQHALARVVPGQLRGVDAAQAR